MNRFEFEQRINEEKMLTIHEDGIEKHYIKGESLFVDGVRQNKTNCFGIYKGELEEYVVFITDNERGIPNYIRTFSSEEIACEALYQKISRLERIYQNQK